MRSGSGASIGERLCGALLLAVLALPASAQLATWDPVGASTGGLPLPVTSAESSVVAGDLEKAPSLAGVAIANTFAAQPFPIGPLDTLRYFEFSIGAASGWEIAYETVTFSLSEPVFQTGAGAWELRSSVDGYVSALDSGFTNDLSLASPPIEADISSLGTRPETVVFRLYFFDALGGFADVRAIRSSGLGGGVGLQVFGTPLWAGVWQQRNTDGFGDTTDIAVLSLATFGGHLYAGTENGKIWRTSDGATWTEVAALGTGGSPFGILLGAVFGGALYAGSSEATGGVVYRSFDGTTWTPVSPVGFGNADNLVVWPLTVFGGRLYASTEKPVPFGSPGGELWRSDDGTSWTQVNANGFGNPNNASVNLGVEFGGRLYAGTRNSFSGGELWSSPDGSTWTQVTDPSFPTGLIGESVWPGPVFKDQIYVGTIDTTGAGRMFRSSDGTSWGATDTGIGGGGNFWLLPTLVFDGILYAVTSNIMGGEVWTSSDGSSWTLSSDTGFGDPNNRRLSPLVAFGTGVYAGTAQEAFGTGLPEGGGEVWAALPEPGSGASAVGGLLVAVLARRRSRPRRNLERR